MTVVDIRRYGARALLVTPRSERRPARLASAITHRDVVEVVPGAETVLVVALSADALTGVADSIVGLEGEVVRAGSVDGLDREVVLDVVYDGDRSR